MIRLRSNDSQAVAGLLAHQALESKGGRRLLAAAVRDLARQSPQQKQLIREIGAKICQIAGARELRAIASAVAADGSEESLVAHDELLSGFWYS
jgi:hypothetical protein